MDIITTIRDCWVDPRWGEPTTTQLAAFGLEVYGHLEAIESLSREPIPGLREMYERLMGAACFCQTVGSLPSLCFTHAVPSSCREAASALAEAAKKEFYQAIEEMASAYEQISRERGFGDVDFRLVWWQARDQDESVRKSLCDGDVRKDQQDLEFVHKAYRYPMYGL